MRSEQYIHAQANPYVDGVEAAGTPSGESGLYKLVGPLKGQLTGAHGLVCAIKVEPGQHSWHMLARSQQRKEGMENKNRLRGGAD